ncbi:unnamed protein product [Trifolium pratense]|uniref:Uncharacterized protein n=1 Tax=Trifolium pratense TaxID=57577 RepID=A0ACB0MA85_TRIPR|nr:unnamed protein product [Trifolium pratense]
MKLFQAEILEHMERLEVDNASKFDKVYSALDILIEQTPTKQNHGVGLNNRTSFKVQKVKLEFPRFDGTNVHEWIFKAEHFFEYYDTPDLDRLTISSVHLDKDVVPWYQMMQQSRPFTSWVEFTRALELDIGPSIYECPRATLLKLTQTGTVAEYYLQFTSLANRVYGLSNDALIDCFISGLNAEIRRDVIVHTPISIVKAVSLAKTQSVETTTNSLITNQPEHHLSLNAMKGTSNMGVLRFAGSIEHIAVQVLIDGSSSDNFLQPRIAKFFKLPIEPGPQFKVLVGNGEIMTAGRIGGGDKIHVMSDPWLRGNGERWIPLPQPEGVYNLFVRDLMIDNYKAWNVAKILHKMRSNDDHDVPLVSTNRWEKPRIRWLKCNVDAIFFVDAGRTAMGACFRNNSGDFTAGLMWWQQLTLSTEEGETWTLLQAMNESKGRGFERIRFESDSQVLVDAICTKR